MNRNELDEIMADVFDIDAQILYDAIYVRKCNSKFSVDLRAYYVFALRNMLGYTTDRITKVTGIKSYQCYYYLNRILDDDSPSNKYYVKQLYKRLKNEQSKNNIRTYTEQLH